MECHEEDEVEAMCQDVQPEPHFGSYHSAYLCAGVVVATTPTQKTLYEPYLGHSYTKYHRLFFLLISTHNILMFSVKEVLC